MAELDWAAKLSLTVGLCAGRLGSTSGWGDGGLQMCAYAAYAPLMPPTRPTTRLCTYLSEALDGTPCGFQSCCLFGVCKFSKFDVCIIP